MRALRGNTDAAGRWVEAEDGRQGRWEEARALLNGHESDAHAARPLAQLHLARGERELAATVLRRYLATHRGVGAAPALALLAEVELATGRVEEARAVRGTLLAMAATTAVASVQAFAALVAGMTSDDVDCVPHLEAALAGFVATGLPLEEARTRLLLARRLAPSNPEVAVAEAKTALTVFDRRGVTHEADVAAALLRGLGVRGRTGPKDVGVLSKREQQVLHLLGFGLSNPEIAARLFISRKTASHHVSNVLSKLGLRNRAEAAAFARTSLP